MRRQIQLVAIAATLGGIVSCMSQGDDGSEAKENALGTLAVELTKAPADTACLRVTVSGDRADVRSFPLTPGQKSELQLKGLPVGRASVSGDAFAVACNKVVSGVEPTWYSEPVGVKINADSVAHVSLLMIHNGRASVAVDFSDDHAPSTPDMPKPTGGAFSSQKPYLVPVDSGIMIRAIFTAGDSANDKPDGTPYRMVGIPDGLGAFDNGDGTFTLLSNHEISSATAGIERAHGAKGAFVSRWTIRKADLAVLKGEDLIQQMAVWNITTSAYDAPAKGIANARFCSADLAAPGAFYDPASGLGFDGRLFLDGEETGAEGRPWAHGLDGTSYELARLGNASWENLVANPLAQTTTIVAGLDDSTPGQVYFYVGTKQSSGSAIDKAGLTNGQLYGLKVTGVPTEDTATGIAKGPFELFPLGNVENMTGAQLETASNTGAVTRLQRPEDGAWDPNDPNDFYFVTTASFTTPSRLWRARFSDVRHPEQGGEFEMLLDGTEGQKMFDNITIDQYGHVYLVEDVGGNDHLGKVWRYDLAADTLTEIAHSNPALFDPTMTATFLTNDEEASGIIDASDVLGPGWLLLDEQNHKASSDPELFEGGQFMAIYDPAAAGL